MGKFHFFICTRQTNFFWLITYADKIKTNFCDIVLIKKMWESIFSDPDETRICFVLNFVLSSSLNLAKIWYPYTCDAYCKVVP